MGATRRDAVEPGDNVPDDSASECRKDNERVDDIGIDNAGAERLRDMQAEEKEGDEIEERRPEDSVLRPQDPCRNDGRDGVRRVVQTVEEIEEQRNGDQPVEQREGESGVHQTFSITMPLISLATSSRLSTTFSSVS